MTTVAEFSLPPTEFVLAWTLQTVDDVEVTVERMVVNGNGRVTPYFWASGDALDEFDRALDDDITVTDAVVLEKGNGKRFYRVRWQEQVRGVLYALSGEVASVVSATYNGEAWSLRTLFADRETLSEFHHYCATYDVDMELDRLYDRSNPRSFGKYEVTSEQEQALTAALEAGFFDVPRQVTLAELADELDISEQAVSARIRRGSANLILNTLRKKQEA
jgi:predicted DNA binding protein